MKYLTRSMVCFLLIGILSACNDGNNHHSSSETTNQKTESEVNITISSPKNHSMYNLEQDIEIIGTIESNDELHGYEISIVQKSNDKIVFSKQVHEHEKLYKFSEVWKNEVNGMQDMELRVTVILDHKNHTTTETVKFHCHGKM